MPLLVFQLVVSVIVFAGVFLLIYALFRYPVPVEPPVHRQIAAAMGRERDTLFEQALIAPLMSLARHIAARLNAGGLRARVRQDLQAAGNPSGYSVDEYIAICMISGVGLAAAMLVVQVLLGATGLAVFLPVMAFLGFMAPLMTLRAAANRRVIAIAKQLPYTLDLIALTMASGSGFTESIETLIRDDPEDDLNQELRIVLSEIEFGSTRASALTNLAERIPLESLRSVVAAVNQADRLGTPLSVILKLQADMLRQHRSVIAEKKSASASLRILVPSMLILLAVVGVVFAPLIIRALRGSIL